MSDPYDDGYDSEREVSLDSMLEKMGGVYGDPPSRFDHYFNNGVDPTGIISERWNAQWDKRYTHAVTAADQEPLSPQDVIAEGNHDFTHAEMDTYEFANMTDNSKNMVVRRRDETFTEGYVPNIFLPRWEDVHGIREFIESVTEKNTVDGKYRTTILKFRDFPDGILPTVFLAENTKKISAVIAYAAAVMFLKRLNELEPEDRETKFFKVIVNVISVWRKMEPNADGGFDPVFAKFSHEEELHRYLETGIPWGFSSPSMLYKIAFTEAQRAVWKTSISSSGWSFCYINEAAIHMYEVSPIHGRGKRDFCHFRRVGEDDESTDSDSDIDPELQMVLAERKKLKVHWVTCVRMVS